MTATPLQVIHQLGQLSAQMDALVDALDAAEHAAAEARAEAAVAEAKAFLRAEGPMDIRRAKSKIEAARDNLAAEIADVNVRTLRRRLNSIITRIEVGRTYSATIRAELATLPGTT